MFSVATYFDVIDRLKKEVGASLENVLLRYNPKTGLIGTHISPQEYKNFLDCVKKKASSPKFIENIVGNLKKSLSEILPYFEGEKFVKNKKELKKLYDLFVTYYLDMSYPWFIPIIEGVPEKTREEVLRAREETEKYSSKRDELFDRNLAILYPELGELVHFLHPDDVFKNNYSADKLKEIAQEKTKGYLCFHRQLVLESDIDKFLAENNIRLFDGTEKISVENGVKGAVAFKGVARGVVKLVFTKKDLDKIKDGDILVSPMTRPEYLPAMSLSAAFVTDEGGITCHAAIVAREMNKPCIIGTKIATQVLHDGDLVEVDADNGIVRILERGK